MALHASIATPGPFWCGQLAFDRRNCTAVPTAARTFIRYARIDGSCRGVTGNMEKNSAWRGSDYIDFRGCMVEIFTSILVQPASTQLPDSMVLPSPNRMPLPLISRAEYLPSMICLADS